MRTHGSSSRAFQRRKDAIALARAGWSAATIGRKLRLSARSVRRWKAAFRKHGSAGLRTKPRSGRPNRLSSRQRRDLRQRLIRGASSQGFDTDLWTCPRIARVIKRLYRVAYHVDHIPRLMATLGFSVQRPERRARERDEPAIRAWIERTWPRLKKRRPGDAARSFSSMKPAFFSSPSCVGPGRHAARPPSFPCGPDIIAISR
jgi:transposase